MFDKIGIERYRNFLALVYKLVVEEKSDFDLIVGPANSGIFLAESVRMLYNQVGIEAPKILIMPIQRREIPGTDTGEYFDNSVVSDSIKRELSDLKRLERVLFVDDEIGRARTPEEVIRVVLMSVDEKIISGRVLYTIVAENHGFEWRYDLPPVAIRYYSFGNKIKWTKTDDLGKAMRNESGMDVTGEHINGSVFYIMSDELSDKYSKFTFNLDETRTRVVGKKELAAIFSNGNLQSSKNGLPILTLEPLEVISKKVPDFDSDRQEFIEYVSNLIKEVVDNYEEYKKSKIVLD